MAGSLEPRSLECAGGAGGDRDRPGPGGQRGPGQGLPVDLPASVGGDERPARADVGDLLEAGQGPGVGLAEADPVSEIPTLLSLGVILVILAVTIAASLLKVRSDPAARAHAGALRAQADRSEPESPVGPSGPGA
jgi:hypothetical protein